MGGWLVEIVEHVPAQDPVDAPARLRKARLEEGGKSVEPLLARVPIEVCAQSSTKILHPSCSPKNFTLGPTTGPRSSNCGDGRERGRRKAGERFGRVRGRIGRADLRIGIPVCAAGRTDRRAPKQASGIGPQAPGLGQGEGFGKGGCDHCRLVPVAYHSMRPGLILRPQCVAGAAVRPLPPPDRRLAGCGAPPARPSAACRRFRGGSAPSAMATRGEMMSPSTEPPSRMSTFSDAVRCRSPAEHDDDLARPAPCLAVRADGQNVVLQLDLPST